MMIKIPWGLNRVYFFICKSSFVLEHEELKKNNFTTLGGNKKFKVPPVYIKG